MLAEITASPSPAALKEWLEVFLYLGGIILTAAGIWRLVRPHVAKTEIDGQPIETKAHAGVATQVDLKQVHGRIDRERKEINDQIRRVEELSEKRSDALDENLRANTAMTQEMSGTVKQMNMQLQTLNGTISSFLQTTPKNR